MDQQRIKKYFNTKSLIIGLMIILLSMMLFLKQHAFAALGPNITLSEYSSLPAGGPVIDIYGSGFELGIGEFKSVSAGHFHSCALSSNDQIYCWGMGSYGLMGNGSNSNQPIPNPINKPAGVNSWKSISNGNQHICAIADNNQAYCWGQNGRGQLGNGNNSNQSTPAQVLRPTGVNWWKNINTGFRHTCAIADNDQMYCWGYGANGRLGNGLNSDQSTPVLANNPAGVTGWQNVFAGADQSCAFATNDQIYCWGRNSYGQLGNGNTTDQPTLTQVILPTNVNSWKELKGVWLHYCAVADNDQMYCWGRNNDGQLGNGNTNNQSSPVQIASVSGAGQWQTFSPGANHTCAIAANHQMYCWGDNSTGSLGNNTTTNSLTPVQVVNPVGVTQWTDALNSYDHNCAIADDNQTYCWGWGFNYVLGNGDQNHRLVPTLVDITKVDGSGPAVQFGGITVAKSDAQMVNDSHLRVKVPAHAVGKVDITISNNPTDSQTYLDIFEYTDLSPGLILTSISKIEDNYFGGEEVIVQGDNFVNQNYKQVSAATYHTCAIDLSSQIVCWGRGSEGLLGNGLISDQFTPVPINNPVGVNSWRSVETGFNHTCAIADNDQAYCWGKNDRGQIGDGSMSDEFTPTLITRPAGVNSWRTIKTGFAHACAIADNNQAYCWGGGSFGVLGNGSSSDQNTPTLVTNPTGVSSWKAIRIEYSHACAIADNDQAYCWGRGTSGKLGNGFIFDRNVPTLVTNPTGITGWKNIGVGRNHSCAIADNDQAYCWGGGMNGTLGNGSTSDQNTPILVTNPAGISSWKTIQTGAFYTCAIADNNQAYCWGESSYGRLGNGSTSDQSTPVLVTNPTGVNSWKVIRTGFYHTCAIADNNQAYCWGGGEHGRLGNGMFSDQSTPKSVFKNITFLLDGKQVINRESVDDNNFKIFIPAIFRSEIGQKDIKLKDNNSSQESNVINNGFTYNDITPIITNITPNQGPIAGGTSVTINGSNFSEYGIVDDFNYISAGANYNCGLTNTGLAYCWGEGTDGQLGNGSNSDHNIATLVTNPIGVNSWKAIGAGQSHTCAIANNDQMYCWGEGTDGQLGNGSNSDHNSPALVTNPIGVGSWQNIGVGWNHTCAIADNNQAYCWGDGSSGALGNGSTSDQNTPTLVTNPAGVSSWKTIKIGQSHACSIANNDQAYCWGNGDSGVLGNNSTSNQNIPTLVTNPAGVSSWQSIQADTDRSCAIADNNQAYCWGQVSNANRLTPISITDSFGANNWRSIQVGNSHYCAVNSSDQAYCWGENDHGQLGNILSIDRHHPSYIVEQSNIEAHLGSISQNGIANLTNINYVSDTQITATTSAHSSGYVDINLTNPTGEVGLLNNGYRYRGTAPQTAPTNLTSNITVSLDQQQVQLSWIAPTDNGGEPITDYDIFYCQLVDPITSSNPNPDCVNEGDPNQWQTYTHNPADINDLTTNNPNIVISLTSSQHGYKFVVRAINSEGHSPLSNESSSRLSYLSIAVDSNNLEAILEPNPIDEKSVNQTITTATNYPNGYNLTVSTLADTNQSQRLIRDPANFINPLSAAMNNPINLTTNTWGFRLPNDQTTFGDSSNKKYLPVPQLSNKYQIQTNNSSTENDTTLIEYGFRVDNTNPDGAYQQTVVYTMISRN